MFLIFVFLVIDEPSAVSSCAGYTFCKGQGYFARLVCFVLIPFSWIFVSVINLMYLQFILAQFHREKKKLLKRETRLSWDVRCINLLSHREIREHGFGKPYLSQIIFSLFPPNLFFFCTVKQHSLVLWGSLLYCINHFSVLYKPHL